MVRDKGVHVSLGRCSSYFVVVCVVARVLNDEDRIGHDTMLAGRLYSYAVKV